MDARKTAKSPDSSAWPSSPRPSVEEILRAVHVTSLTRELDLSYARGLTARSFKAILMCLPNLRKLSMCHTEIGRLPDVFRYVPELRELDISNNDLSKLPASLGELSQLQHLTAVGNRLQSLPQSLGRLHNLRFLNVSSNRIVALGPEIVFLKSLRVLRLASNRLVELHPGVGQLPQLQLLQLSFNRLRRLPDELGHAAQLRVLNVGFNALTELPDSFAALTGLAHLDLTGNDILQLPCCLAHLDALRVRGFERSNWRIGAQPDDTTQVTAEPSARHTMLWSDTRTSRTREIDLSPVHAARAVIGSLKRALDTVTGHTQVRRLPPRDKTVVHGQHYTGQVAVDPEPLASQGPTRVGPKKSAAQKPRMPR